MTQTAAGDGRLPLDLLAGGKTSISLIIEVKYLTTNLSYLKASFDKATNSFDFLRLKNIKNKLCWPGGRPTRRSTWSARQRFERFFINATFVEIKRHCKRLIANARSLI